MVLIFLPTINPDSRITTDGARNRKVRRMPPGMPPEGPDQLSQNGIRSSNGGNEAMMPVTVPYNKIGKELCLDRRKEFGEEG